MPCPSDCSGRCYSDCTANCSSDCNISCKGCSGCRGGCTSCSGCRGCTNCTGSCTSCSGCSGCTGTCQGSCTNSCTGKCNTACTAEAQAEIIAHLGENIAVGNLIKATEYLQLKSAIDQEYIRRGKQAPEGFLQTPQAKGNVLLSTAQKIMDDVYGLDNEPEHDWRGVFQSGTVVPPSKWQPSILYIKTLAAEIVP